MELYKNNRRSVSPIRILLSLLGFSWFGVVSFCSSAQGQTTNNSHGYKPQYQKITYRSDVPTTILRIAKKVGPTRFFGTFNQGGKTFAIHFYDVSRVRRSQRRRTKHYPYGDHRERNSRLDVFQLGANKSWRRTQSSTVSRMVRNEYDKFWVAAQSLWLDPKRKKLPLVYLQVMDNTGLYKGITDIYGVLLDKPTPKAFITFDGDLPYSMTTVAYSEISYPDSRGQLTIVFNESNNGSVTSFTSYGWSGKKWNKLASARVDDTSEQDLRWNGRQFVRLKR